MATACDQHIRGALHEAAYHRFPLLILHVVEGAHELVVRVEGYLGYARIALARAFDTDTAFLGQHDQGTFGGVANQVLTIQAGICAQRHRQHHFVQIDRFSSIVEQLSLCAVAFAGHLVVIHARDAKLACRHLVESQRAGLIGADGGYRAKCLH